MMTVPGNATENVCHVIPIDGFRSVEAVVRSSLPAALSNRMALATQHDVNVFKNIDYQKNFIVVVMSCRCLLTKEKTENTVFKILCYVYEDL